MSKKIYIIAAEASADLHTSKIVKALKIKNPNWEFFGWGGNKMEAEGVKITTQYKDVSFMGFLEVIKNIKTIYNLFKKTKKEILQINPDIVLLVDYPGFNLRIAKWLYEKNIITYYFISPQLWAWKEGRIESIKKYIHKLIVILPFEKTYYKERNLDVFYAGHPLLDAIKEFKPNVYFREKNKLDCRSIIALLPGSRKQEISTMLPLYLRATHKFKKYQLVIAGLSHHKSLYESILTEFPDSKALIVYDQNYDILHQARIAVVTSGTATLETALFNIPQVVCYKGNSISYYIAKNLIKIKYISLVNLIMDNEIVKELIQYESNIENIEKECEKLLDPSTRNRNTMKQSYKILHSKLGDGNSIPRIADYLDNEWKNL